jgi:radical SAM-linked protein
MPVERAMVDDLNAYPFPSGGPVSSTETIFDRVSVEIARGCTEGCRFCQAGMIYRPVRERDPQSILDSITTAVREGGYDEASLTSLSTADYSAIHPLVKAVMKKLEQERISLSVSSLRAYGLDEDLLDELKKVRATGLTFAHEAGSQRMRDVVNKNVTEEQLMTTAERVFSRGWSKMKLYFMIGLPTEEEEDVRGIVRTGAKAQSVGKRVQKGRGPQVTVSVSIHVPKPHTPFQWCAMDPRDQVVGKQGWLREEAKRSGIKLRMHDSEGSWLEGVLARGDRRLADVIEHAYHNGARFDSWDEELRLDVWERAFTEHAIDPAIFLMTIPVTARLPWDHIDVGLEEGFLAREYRKALGSRLSPPCGKVAGAFVHETNIEDAQAETRRLVCYDCGVACDMTQMREERVVYLRTLGADKRPPPRTPRDPNEKATPKYREPPKLLPQEKLQRLRLRYAKIGRASYRGHLDLVRLLPRILRRAGVSLYYSQGFHPKPEMTFGPALPLGIASLDEHVDVHVAGEVQIDGLLDRLNAVSESGIVFSGARMLGASEPRLSKVIEEAGYVAGVAHSVLEELGLNDVEAIRARAGRGELVVHRDLEGGLKKKIDVNELLLGYEIGEGADALREAGIVGRVLPIRFRVRILGSGGVRPTEAIDALLGGRDVPVRLVRESLRGAEGRAPLEFVHFSKAPAAVTHTASAE